VESEKVGLKLNIQKMKIMASGPITSWEIDGETVETVSDFIFLFIIYIYIFFYILFYFLTLQYCISFAIYHMNLPQVYT